ncbi:hypothetical protein HII31_02060 [Pseudocercospora fuligena]|uniref:Uncharacterized protein n=1 Tax=Pseudocercospora fuligena TaxID=685502 RepID=A0A8H6VLZ6_9PEZI|nr:hypothetical protein HII31_02060 [Pseudocercospora fuligena]
MYKVRDLLIHYILLIISASLSSAVKYRIDRDHYGQHGYHILDNIENEYDFSYARITAGAQRYEDARNSRRQVVQGSTTYQQTTTTTFIGTDGFTTAPYATNGQQCSTISNNIMAVRDP